jgi:hypothetical protein
MEEPGQGGDDMVKYFTALLLAIALAALVGGGGTADKASTKPPSTQEAPPKGGTEPAAKVAPVEIGQAATAGSWTLTAKKVERMAEAGGAKADAGSELLVITFDLNNDTGADQGTGPSSFALTGTDGTAYTAASTSDPAFIFNTAQPIKAGETREIKIAYGVPAGTSSFQWSFTPFMESGEVEPAVVNIK